MAGTQVGSDRLWKVQSTPFKVESQVWIMIILTARGRSGAAGRSAKPAPNLIKHHYRSGRVAFVEKIGYTITTVVIIKHTPI